MSCKKEFDPPWLRPTAAYVHVPFCQHHCGYCDFAVATGVDERIDEYIAAVDREMALLLTEPPVVETVFIGGGTPTYLSESQLDRLLTSINRRLGLSNSQPEAGIEFSIESTPESLTDEKVKVLADHGVNRVSIGVQSFNAPSLQMLERVHTPGDVPRAVDCVRRQIGNISLDLIFGVPGQSLADWNADLTQALSLEPQHISTYGLTYEKGTPLWQQRKRGLVLALDEDTELSMYLHALDVLEAAGLQRYEVSNHARPGYECRHNRVYWSNWAYFGFGVGATRYIRGVRAMNTRSLANYLGRIRENRPATIQSETLSPIDLARETISTQIRRVEGISRSQFQTQTGLELDELAGPRIRRHVSTGMLADDGERVALTRSGICVADTLIAELMS